MALEISLITLFVMPFATVTGVYYSHRNKRSTVIFFRGGVRPFEDYDCGG